MTKEVPYALPRVPFRFLALVFFGCFVPGSFQRFSKVWFLSNMFYKVLYLGFLLFS